MATIEQVEKLREKARVTYDEARSALDACGGDMLEAMIYLERQGKVEPPQNGGYYNAKSETQPEAEETGNSQSANSSPKGETFASLASRFFKWCGRLIAKGNVNIFEVWRHGSVVISLPVTVLVLLLILAFWIVVPLVIFGLFFGCRYIFKGPDLENSGVNNVMDSAADAAENLKKEVKDNHHGDHH